MLANAFIGKTRKPTEDELSTELGPTKVLWDRLVAVLAAEHEVTIREWKCESANAGWSQRPKRAKRTIAYLSPCRGCFRVGIVLGNRAVESAHQTRLPPRALLLIKEAPRYAEGTGVRIKIKGPWDLVIVKKLAAIKLKN